jgi:hypothetical protein
LRENSVTAPMIATVFGLGSIVIAAWKKPSDVDVRAVEPFGSIWKYLSYLYFSFTATAPVPISTCLRCITSGRAAACTAVP